MPIVNIDAGWLNELLGQSYPPETLGEALEQIGCDVDEVVDIERYRCPACDAVLEASLGAETVRSCGQCGHGREQPFELIDRITVIRLDLLAARPDLFDIGGLARALQGYLGRTEGLPPFELGASTVVVEVSSDVEQPESYRPFIRCAVVELPPLDDRMLTAIMKLQENLHWGVGRDRKLASIGVYDLDRVRTPIRYRTIDPDAEPFEPLGAGGSRMSGRQILELHPKGVAYAHLLAEHRRYPALVDADGQTLSMPPIINSEGTKVRAGTQRLFIDVTGISEAAVQSALCTLVCSLMELGAKVRTVRIERASGEGTLTPDLAPRTAEIELARARQWLGLPLDADSLAGSLRRMRLGVEAVDAAKTRFVVRYPAFRSDIRHMVDVFEDVAIGFGYSKIEASLVPTMTVSTPRPEETQSDLVRQVLIGLGYSEVMSLPVTTEADHYARFRLPIPDRYVRVGNPKLKALTVVRSHLMSGVMQALHDNRRRPMPLRVFEIDNAVALDADHPHGAHEARHLCFAEAGKLAGYASARAALDALLRELGLEGRYEPVEHPAFIAGRVARLRAGELEGIVGELHPEVVVGFGLDHPVALAELGLRTVA